jgi:hypothetical protein
MLRLGADAMLSLPLWFVTERRQKPLSDHAPCDDPGVMLAFTTTEKLTEFLATSNVVEWKINLAGDREGLILVIAIAHNHGAESICIDSDAGGNGGKQVTLSDLLIFANSLK